MEKWQEAKMTNMDPTKDQQAIPIPLSVVKPEIRNAIDVYIHYGIEVPFVDISMDEVKTALAEISNIDHRYEFYCKMLWKYLDEKQVNIRDYVLEDKHKDMLKYTGVSGGHWAENYYRNIFLLLCNKYKILALSLELCIVPDMYLYCDKYDTNAMDKGCPEAFLGVLPYSLIWGFSKESILMSISVPMELLGYIKRFLLGYRVRCLKKHGANTDSTTLITACKSLRKLVLELKIKSFKELEGEKGAQVIRDYFNKTRIRTTKKRKIKYRYKRDTRTLGQIKYFFYCMSPKIGIINPFSIIDPNYSQDLAEEDQITIIDGINTPRDESEYYARRVKNKQIEVGIRTDDNRILYTSPCFEGPEMFAIARYIKTRYDSIISGLEPKWELMDARHMMAYHNILQEDLVLILSFLTGSRPCELESMCIENLGPFSTDMSSFINERFKNSIVPFEVSVKESRFKKRPAKMIYWLIFVFIATMLKVRTAICKKKNRNIPQNRKSFMSESGTPLFMSRLFRRASYCALTDQFRRALGRVGINTEKIRIATIYFCRKSFVIYARQWGLSIENVSSITGTSPQTLFEFYDYLKMIQDTQYNYVNGFLKRLDLKPDNIVVQGQAFSPVTTQAEVPFNTFDALDMRDLGPVNREESCGIKEAINILNSDEDRDNVYELKFTKYLLLQAKAQGCIKGSKKGNKWTFSKKSIYAFAEKYVDASGVIRMFKKCRRKIKKRRALAIMSGYLKNFTITLGNRVFVERSWVHKYLDKLS